jgi:hypothetical protein
MFYASLLLLCLSPQVPQPPNQEAPQPTTAPTYDQGPLRVELLAMREIRFSATDPEMAAKLRSELGMQFRIRGERIAQIVRQGTLIFSELVDDTGQSLLDPNTYSEADKMTTRVVQLPPDRLRSDGLIVMTRNNPSTRGSQKLTKARGSIRLILAEQTEKLTIESPMQFYGKVIADPRLQALGMEIRIVPLDELENPPPAERALVLQFVAKGDLLQRASFNDGTMRPLPARDQAVTTKSGQPCQLYYFDATPFNDETQMVLEIHPQIDDVQLPIELDGLKLP